MDDLIRRKDAERALTLLGAQLSEKHTRTVAKCICAIKDVPAVDVEPVRYGRWLNDGECSLCGHFDKRDPFGSGYCPNCGAKMDAKEE